jgi:hypothetical protein
MTDPARIQRVSAKLTQLWAANPGARLGQLLELVENTAWDLCTQRVCAPRLMHLPDELFEAALDRHLHSSSTVTTSP